MSHIVRKPMQYVNNKDTDQLVHSPSLISVFIVRCLDSIISVEAIPKISRHKLGGQFLIWWHALEDRFSHDVAHILKGKAIKKVNMSNRIEPFKSNILM